MYQRVKGHRFSSDDMVTAWTAMQVRPDPQRVLDLGCGLGSVLLHLAWCAPTATLVGLEAQEVSFTLARRNVAHNHLGDRVTVHHGDVRDAKALAGLGGPFDLITGTPPYFPAGQAIDATDAQRAMARLEHRGGIEAYVEAAASLLTDDGWFVVCADSDAEARLDDAARRHGFGVVRRVVVHGREGRPPLFTVWALRRLPHCATPHDTELTLRTADGQRSAHARMLRAFSGFPETER